ncbi:MAG: HEAT repeat domain-containing protein, partial [Proteobacteria bacterium]|nr:HEAT repeat domain-containing protein [Pseudomonadota bacterium]
FLYTALLIGTSAFFYGPGLNSSLAIVTPAEYLRSNMEALALQIRETENARQRYFLATHLAAYGTPSLDFLLPMLKDDDPEIRIAAAHQMRNVPSSEAVPALIEALGDSLEDVRGSALLALALITAPESVEPMRRLLLDPIPWVQVRALQSLAAMGEDVSEFASVGLESPHLWYRIRCLNVLGMLRNERTVAQVEHQLASENAHIRRAVVAALASIGSAESRQALERAQSDDDWEVRMYATEALEILNSKEK